MIRTCLLFGYFLIAFAASGQNGPLTCGVTDAQTPPLLRQLMQRLDRDSLHNRARLKASPLLECRLGIDVDYGMYQHFNGDQAKIRQYIFNVINDVSRVYEAEINVRLTVTQFQIWTEQDPYPTANSLGSHLFALNTWWQDRMRPAGNYDCVVGFTTKRDPTLGGIAMLTFGQLSHACVVGHVNKTYLPIQTTAHEIGHQFGSVHTHNCSWPGGPIDICGPVEGCPQTYEQEYQLGTIMSYCGDVLTFHPYCRAVMRQSAESTGLAVLEGVPATPQPIPVLPVASRQTAPYFTWTTSLRAVRYRVQLATDSTFNQVLTDTLVAREYWQVSGLKADASYYWRVRAVGVAAQSEWSVRSRITIGLAAQLHIPLLRYPADRTQGYNSDLVNWYPAPLATQYRVQLSNGSQFSYIIEQQVVTGTSVRLAQTRSACPGGCTLFWRVRAEQGNQVSDWSDVFSFTGLPVVDYLRPEDFVRNYYRYSTSFTTAAQVSSLVDARVTYQVSPFADFRSITHESTRLINQVGAPNYEFYTQFMTEGLAPNTTYQYRIKAAANGIEGNWKNGTFTTGSYRPTWRFFNAANSSLNLGSAQVTALAVAQNGTVWVGTYNGLFRSLNEGKDWTRLSTLSTGNLLNSYVADMALDAQQQLWVVNPKSLARFDGTNWKRFVLPVANINGSAKLAISRDSVVYIVTDRQLLQFKNQQWTIRALPAGYPQPQSCLVDRNGHVWLSAYNSKDGVARFDGVDWTVQTSANSSLPVSENLRMATDTSGSQIWVSCLNGVARWLGDRRWETTYSNQFSFPGDNFNGIVFDRKNRLLALGQFALHQYDGRQWSSLREKSIGYPSYNPFAGVDAENRLWLIAGVSPALAVYDERTIRPGATAIRYCAGDSVQLSFTPDFVPRPGTQFAVQLSDSLGVQYRSLPALVTTNRAAFLLPPTLRPGSNYQLRIVAENPAIIGENTASFTVVGRPAATLSSSMGVALCAGQSTTLTANATDGAYQWLSAGVPIAGATTLSYAVAKAGTYSLQIENNGCRLTTAPVSVTVADLPDATITPQGPIEVNEPDRAVLWASQQPGLRYQWLLEGAVIAGASSFSIAAGQSGQYAVVITNPAGCSMVSAPISIRINKALAVDPVAAGLVLTPNPVAQTGRLAIPLGWSGPVKLTLIAASGRVVWQQTAGATQKLLEISAGSLAAGSYILWVEHQQTKYALKLLKQ